MSGMDSGSSARFDVVFPLTLALSLRERGQQSRVSVSPRALLANPASGFAVGRNTILPLPKGEGRGEGEGSVFRSIAFLLAARATNQP